MKNNTNRLSEGRCQLIEVLQTLTGLTGSTGSQRPQAFFNQRLLRADSRICLLAMTVNTELGQKTRKFAVAQVDFIFS